VFKITRRASEGYPADMSGECIGSEKRRSRAPSGVARFAAPEGQSQRSLGQRPGNCHPPQLIGPIGRISQIGRIASGGWLMCRPFRVMSQKRNTKTRPSG
jgi:hypothetical protein